MDSESKNLPDVSKLPGLSEWHTRQVLLVRCQDITQEQFLQRVDGLFELVEQLFEQSLPESMEEETYLVAKEYYDTASDGLDCYLSGLEALRTWVNTNNSAVLEVAAQHFAKGDEYSKKVIPLAIEAQESFRQTDEALLKSLKGSQG